ncbi:GNAT family acetyltransferase [Candidatus Zixiibacteriota bacterium]|nr:GNAT family acetyltransferase [candidate division Zixibacteria bacterium]
MTMEAINPKSVKFRPLDNSTWKDFEKLMGEKGGCGGCWCMSWRVVPKVFRAQSGGGNKKAIRKLVRAGEPIGVIGYFKNDPIGWCAVAPREKYPRLENSKVLAPIDDKPVWSVSCLLIKKEYRRKGVSSLIIRAAVDYAKKMKAQIVEGYPSVPYAENIPAAFAWTGIPSAFEKAGFAEAARRSKSRPIMRVYLKKK